MCLCACVYASASVCVCVCVRGRVCVQQRAFQCVCVCRVGVQIYIVFYIYFLIFTYIDTRLNVFSQIHKHLLSDIFFTYFASFFFFLNHFVFSKTNLWTIRFASFSFFCFVNWNICIYIKDKNINIFVLLQPFSSELHKTRFPLRSLRDFISSFASTNIPFSYCATRKNTEHSNRKRTWRYEREALKVFAKRGRMVKRQLNYTKRNEIDCSVFTWDRNIADVAVKSFVLFCGRYFFFLDYCRLALLIGECYT